MIVETIHKTFSQVISQVFYCLWILPWVLHPVSFGVLYDRTFTLDCEQMLFSFSS